MYQLLYIEYLLMTSSKPARNMLRLLIEIYWKKTVQPIGPIILRD
jgi:hypothetical protein